MNNQPQRRNRAHDSEPMDIEDALVHPNEFAAGMELIREGTFTLADLQQTPAPDPLTKVGYLVRIAEQSHPGEQPPLVGLTGRISALELIRYLDQSWWQATLETEIGEVKIPERLLDVLSTKPRPTD